MTIAQDQAAQSGWVNGLYNGMTPQDFFNQYGYMPPPDPQGSGFVDSNRQPYVNGVSQGPAYRVVDSTHATSAYPEGSLLPADSPEAQQMYPVQQDPEGGGLGGFVTNVVGPTFGPALAFTGAGMSGLLGGATEGASALAPAASTAYDPALMNAAYSGMGATGVGSTAAGLGAGGEGLLAAGSSLPVDAGIAGFGGASTLGGLGAAGTALGGLGGASGASGLTSTQNSTFGIPNNILGGIAQGALGVLGANAQGNALNDVASQYLNLGAPYRGQLAASYQPGFDLMSQPGYGDAFKRSADIAARSYSAKMGNPADNPTAQAGILSDVWNQSYLPALSNYRGQLGQFGGLGLNTSGSASLAGAGSTGDAWNAAGAAANTILNPPTDIASLLKALNTGGQSNNFSLTAGGLPVR